MFGDQGNHRWGRAVWVLALTGGAIAGSLATSAFGSSQTLIAIVGVGLPLTLALFAFGSTSPGKTTNGRRSWLDGRRANLPHKRPPGPKAPHRRGQLHSINRHKASDPPASGSR